MSSLRLRWLGWSIPNSCNVPETSQYDQVLEVRDTSSDKHITVTTSTQELTDSTHPLIRSSRPVLAHSWRFGASLATLIVLSSLMINIIVSVRLSKLVSSQFGLTQLYWGTCDKVQSISTYVHLGTNALATLMLSGSNYVMQILVAPSRHEIDRAHRKGKWLDIGVPSVKNLTSVSKVRALLWLILSLSSIPLHLLLNSAFYPTLTSHDYGITVVTESYLQDHNLSSLPGGNSSQLGTTYERLENSECINEYAKETGLNRGSLFIVSSNTTSMVSLPYSLGYDSFKITFNGASEYHPYWWMCENSPWAPRNTSCYKSLDAIRKDPTSWSPLGFKAEYCMSERVPSKCSFNVNQSIITVVIVCNTVKAAAMLCVILFIRFDPIVTVGDAIESFLSVCDKTTKEMCLISRDHVGRSLRKVHKVWPESVGQPAMITYGITAVSRRRRWYTALSIRQITVVSFLLISYVFVSVAFLKIALKSLPDSSWTRIKNLGLGSISGDTVIASHALPWLRTDGAASHKILSSSIVTNLPQLILSFLYFNINSFLTTMLMAKEWSDYAVERKTLRVSRPKAGQRGTYFLHLPYRVMIPLEILTTVSHWIVSRTIFLVIVSHGNWTGNIVNPNVIITCGFSPLGIILTTILGVSTTVSLALLSFRKYNAFIPVVSSCSAAIAASCHAQPWEDESAVLKPLQWGAVVPPDDSDENAPGFFFDGQAVTGHCTFSSGEVETPTEGKKYAGLGRD